MALADPARAPLRAGRARPAAEWLRNPWALAGLVGLLAAAVLWLIVQPLTGTTVDTDAATTVTYFNRLIHGQRLEALLPTTPKPLLTVVFGLIWTLTGDWRTLTILTVAVGAAAVAMAARLAARLGGVGAAVIVAIAVMAWPDFAVEVAHANSFVWGLALWLLAAVLVTADRPRPWLAGVALLLAALTRTETIYLLGAALACSSWVLLRSFRVGHRNDLRIAAPLLVGVLAVPLACLHDLLLTGKPLYWLGVPASYTASTDPNLGSVPPLDFLKSEIVHYRPVAALVVLAVIGVVWLVMSRRRAVAFVLTWFVGAVLVALILLAWRAIFVSTRYYEEADAVVLLAAAIGAAAVIRWSVEWAKRMPGNRSLGWALVSVCVGAATAVIVSIAHFGYGALVGILLALSLVLFLQYAAGSRPDRERWWSLAPGLLAAILVISVVAGDVPHGAVDPSLTRSRQSAVVLETVIAPITTILAGAKGGTTILNGSNYPVVDETSCRMFVPRAYIPLISLETHADLTALGDSFLAFRYGHYQLKAGQWVLHISSTDGLGGAYAPFENAGPTTLLATDGQRVLIVPVIVDPQRGLWLDRVDAAPTS
ncbi:MAG TPA: hypothetical protein VF375_05450 [Candidatus Limnocylindrales bacterium]